MATTVDKEERQAQLAKLDGFGAQELLPKAVKAGWLSKQGGRIKTWKKRYFVLFNHSLFYYKSEKDTHATGQIELIDVSVRENYEGGSLLRRSTGQFQIYVPAQDMASNHEAYTLQADTDATMREWMAAIRSSTLHGYHPDLLNEGPEGPARVFGVPLADALQDGEEVPSVVRETVAYLEQNALQTEGIFRLSGSATQVSLFKALYDRGEEVDLNECQDVHVVAALLKSYLRELPEPLFTFDMYDAWIEAAKLQWEQRLDRFRTMLGQLPSPNRAMLKFLVPLLQKVTKYEAQNMMTVANLATVFGPNLVRPRNETVMSMLGDTPFVIAIINTMTQAYDYIFQLGKYAPAGAQQQQQQQQQHQNSKRVKEKVKPRKARALYPFQGRNDREISFAYNEVILVLKQNDNGWWLGKRLNQDKQGLLPGNYVELLDENESAQAARARVKAQRHTSGRLQVGDLQKELPNPLEQNNLVNKTGLTIKDVVNAFKADRGPGARVGLENLLDRLVREVRELKLALNAEAIQRRELDKRLAGSI